MKFALCRLGYLEMILKASFAFAVSFVDVIADGLTVCVWTPWTAKDIEAIMTSCTRVFLRVFFMF